MYSPHKAGAIIVIVSIILLAAFIFFLKPELTGKVGYGIPGEAEQEAVQEAGIEYGIPGELLTYEEDYLFPESEQITLNIISPADGAEITGNSIEFTGTAYSPAGIAKIEFEAIDFLLPIIISEQESWSFVWDTADMPEGEYDIRIIATDNNNEKASEALLVIKPHTGSSEAPPLTFSYILQELGNYTNVIEIYPTDDTYAADDYVDASAAYRDYLRVGNWRHFSGGWRNSISRAYLRFNLVRIDANENTTINSAELGLYHYDDAGSHSGETYYLYSVLNDTWNETSCNDWSGAGKNCPDPSSQLTSKSPSGNDDDDYWETFDVKNYIANQSASAGGDSIASLMLNRTSSTSSNDHCRFYSKDYGTTSTAYTPYIKVNYTAPRPEPPELHLNKTIIFNNITNITSLKFTIDVTGDPRSVIPEVDVVLVMDRSGSMDSDTPTKMSQAKVAAKTFVDTLDEDYQRSALVSFVDTATLDENLTYTRQDVKDEIDALVASGGTQIGEGIRIATDHLLAQGRPVNDTFWVQVLLSDGDDYGGDSNSSGQALRAADNNITIYTIGLGTGANQTKLETISNLTGGNYYYAPSGDDLLEIYEDIGAEIANLAAEQATLIDIVVSEYVSFLPPLPDNCTNTSINGNTSFQCPLGDLYINDSIEIVINVTVNETYAAENNITFLNVDAYINYTDYEENQTQEYFNNPPVNTTIYWVCNDNDNDGYNVSNAPWLQFLCGPKDCNDGNASINPGAAEICNDGVDNDCDGLIDGADPDCALYPPHITPHQPYNGTQFNDTQNITFNFTATDADNTTLICSIYLDGSLNQTNSSAQNNTVTYFYITGISYGSHNWHINCTDGSSYNVSETRYFTIADTINPAIQFVSPTTATGNYSQSWISANVTASDANLDAITINLYNSVGALINSQSSGISPFYYNFTGLADGTYYLNATANDTYTNTNHTETRMIILDTTPPAIQFVLPTTASGNYSQSWIAANVTASDITLGIDTITIYLYNSVGALVNSQISSTSPVYYNFTGLADGTYYLNATANDTAGNMNYTETRTITLDTQPLKVFILSPASQWYRLNFTVRANVTNGLAGPDTIRYRWENASLNGTYVDMSYNAPYYESVFDITSVADGVYTFRIWANDSAGNINDTEYVINVGIDDTKPTTTDNAPTTWQNADFSFNITCYDATSGCAAIYYSLTGILPFNVSAVNPTTITISTEGTHPLYYYSVDYAANNEYNTALRKYVKLDKTDPNTTVNYTSTSWQKQDIAISLLCDDGALSGCNATYYCIDAANTCDPFTGTLYTTPITHSTEGIRYIRFASKDNANNFETAKSQILKLDKTPPAPPVLTDPGVYTTTGNVTLNWTAAIDATSGIHHYELWRSTNNITFTQVDGDLSNTTLSYTDSGLANNKTYYYYVMAFDNANNNASSNTVDIIVDTNNPGVDIIYPADGQYFNVNYVAVLANFSNTNLVTCEVKHQSSIWYDMDNDNATSGTANYTFTSLADGYYNFTVRCTDESNLTSSDKVYSIIVDTTPPTGTVSVNSGAAYTNTTSVALSLTYSDTLSGIKDCSYSNDNLSWSAWQACAAAKAWTLTAGDGLKTAYYRIRDNALNTFITADVIILDTTLPVVNITNPLNGSYTNDTTPKITFIITDNLAANISYVVLVDGVQDQAGTAVNNTPKSINISTALLETSHNITVRATDYAGNKGTDTIILTVQPQPPVVVINNPPADYTTTSDATPLLVFTITDNSDPVIDYVIYIDSSPMAGGTGTAQYGVPVYKNLTTLAQGYHNITVQGTDDTSNAANATRIIIIDTTPPTAVINAPASGSFVADSTPEINFTLTDNLADPISYTIYIDGIPDGTGTAANNTPASDDLPLLADGSYQVIVEATDNAGFSVNSTAITLNIDTSPPLITNVQPSAGTNYNQSDIIVISANVTDFIGVDKVFANISWDFTSQLVELTDPDLDDIYTYIFTNTAYAGPYNIIITANDTLGFTNTASTYFKVIGSVPPTFIDFYIDPYDPTVGDDVLLNATVVDDGDYSVYANITLPTGTTVTVPVPSLYTTTVIGRHNVTFWANDTDGNIVTEDDYFIVGNLPINVTFNVVDHTLSGIPTNQTIYFTGTNKDIDLNQFIGIWIELHTNISYDIFYETWDDTALVRLNSAELFIDRNNTLGVDRFIAEPGYLITYGFFTDYATINSVDVTLSYAGTGYTNENLLELWKCASWNFTARTCTSSWVQIAAVQNLADHTFTFSDTGFSAFSVKQGTAPTPPGGGGGGGGGPGGFIECTQNWTCADWGGCIYGIQYRTCIDANYCEYNLSLGRVDTIVYVEKPEEERACQYIPPTPPSTCYDGTQNGGETDIDCGGPCGPTCLNGQKCRTNADCINLCDEQGICYSPIISVLEKPFQIIIKPFMFLKLAGKCITLRTCPVLQWFYLPLSREMGYYIQKYTGMFLQKYILLIIMFGALAAITITLYTDYMKQRESKSLIKTLKLKKRFKPKPIIVKKEKKIALFKPKKKLFRIKEESKKTFFIFIILLAVGIGLFLVLHNLQTTPGKCVQDWDCFEWKECSSSGIQQRTCIDVNDCQAQLAEGLVDKIIEKPKPLEQRACAYTEPVLESAFTQVKKPVTFLKAVSKGSELWLSPVLKYIYLGLQKAILPIILFGSLIAIIIFLFKSVMKKHHIHP
jgi:hypothetical protein